MIIVLDSSDVEIIALRGFVSDIRPVARYHPQPTPNSFVCVTGRIKTQKDKFDSKNARLAKINPRDSLPTYGP
jgi:hypothetical protein